MAFPAFNRKGTPSQRALLMKQATAAKVGHRLQPGMAHCQAGDTGQTVFWGHRLQHSHITADGTATAAQLETHHQNKFVWKQMAAGSTWVFVEGEGTGASCGLALGGYGRALAGMQTEWGGASSIIRSTARNGVCFSSTPSQWDWLPSGKVLFTLPSVVRSAVPMLGWCHRASALQMFPANLLALWQYSVVASKLPNLLGRSASLRCRVSPSDSQKPSPALRHSVILQVAQLLMVLSVAPAVLPHNHIFHADGVHVAKHLDLLIADVLCVQADLQGNSFKSSGVACCCDSDGQQACCQSRQTCRELKDCQCFLHLFSTGVFCAQDDSSRADLAGSLPSSTMLPG